MKAITFSKVIEMYQKENPDLDTYFIIDLVRFFWSELHESMANAEHHTYNIPGFGKLKATESKIEKLLEFLENGEKISHSEKREKLINNLKALREKLRDDNNRKWDIKKKRIQAYVEFKKNKNK